MNMFFDITYETLLEREAQEKEILNEILNHIIKTFDKIDDLFESFY